MDEHIQDIPSYQINTTVLFTSKCLYCNQIIHSSYSLEETIKAAKLHTGTCVSDPHIKLCPSCSRYRYGRCQHQDGQVDIIIEHKDDMQYMQNCQLWKCRPSLLKYII